VIESSRAGIVRAVFDLGGSTHDDPVGGLLSVTSRRQGDAVIVAAAGEIDLATAPRLGAAVRDSLAVPGPGPVVVDLTDVTFLASAGLGVLVDAHASAAVRREPLRVVVDHNRPELRPIQLVGLDEVLAQYNAVTDALRDQPRQPGG
jgi:anti-sigma B factor antagonist